MAQELSGTDTQAGLPAAKRVQVNQTATVNLDSTYTYNIEGQITGMTYPNGGPSYNYSYNSMYQLSGMTDASNNNIVSGVSYNAANQLLGMKFNTETETRGYNSLNQLITLSASVPGIALENITYTYPAGANNGKINSMSDTVSGESVAYTYDSLNRLLTAGGNGWGQSYGYDAFGNLLSKTITAGSGPSLSQAVNPANNQIVGQSYDANGNAIEVTNGGVPYNLYYDAENRLSTVYFNPDGQYLEYYGYDAQNRRIWSWPGTLNGSNTTNYTVNVYSPAGQKLGAYLFMTYGTSMNVTLSSSDQYFGGRRLATLDQLGSAGQWGTYKGIYFPWGEDKGGTSPQDTWNYATYWRDSVSGLDYANNRYYSNAYGRFMTPDPYQGNSGGPGDSNNPQTWNRYAYVFGDPVNWIDPSGLDGCPAGTQPGPNGDGCVPDPTPPPGPTIPIPAPTPPTPQPSKGGSGGSGSCPQGWVPGTYGGCVPSNTSVNLCIASVNAQVSAAIQNIDTAILTASPLASGLATATKTALFGIEKGATGGFEDVVATAAGGAALGGITGFIFGFGGAMIIDPFLDPMLKPAVVAVANSALNGLGAAAIQLCRATAPGF